MQHLQYWNIYQYIVLNLIIIYRRNSYKNVYLKIILGINNVVNSSNISNWICCSHWLCGWCARDISKISKKLSYMAEPILFKRSHRFTLLLRALASCTAPDDFIFPFQVNQKWLKTEEIIFLHRGATTEP